LQCYEKSFQQRADRIVDFFGRIDLRGHEPEYFIEPARKQETGVKQ
jgi:hypothetical protein